MIKQSVHTAHVMNQIETTSSTLWRKHTGVLTNILQDCFLFLGERGETLVNKQQKY